ncbi:RipA family octameric membrane protein [Kozakia baliensis]|uniref:Uncharacterized protein n=1 Tax=Kozakia baliensis TaxID=153496 RepID=A0A1D8UUS5_9PROT|nr:hypothetical protein [Kozakia baliensis]AOX17247.1 hypothetical protein A0U89_09010 [Kozakia baliensis]AOX20124.1 hypothetical protein A0U90_07305 [Kozakia baliensis]GBR29782.1 hypothetical protein AA0488_1805 [Kozakia baliensis NRIC 0488]GEL63333.1 hypothetical protein KBA01_06190 [Kozakia baliensis]
MAEPTTPQGPDISEVTTERELLAFYRSEIRFESEVVNGRLQALLTSQAFLVIAYATAMTGSTKRWGDSMVLLIPPLLALLGFMLTFLAWPGIRAAYDAIARWENKQHELHKRCGYLSDFTLAPNDNDTRDMMKRAQEGALFAHRAPLVFLIAWAIFGFIPFYLYWWK